MSTLRLSLPRDPASVGEARHQLSRFADDNELGDNETMLLVVSELVTNAVVHGADPIEVCVSCAPQIVRIEVSDHNPDTSAVAVRQRHPDLPGGWGLEIVGALTRRWGTVGHGDGKTVWAELDRVDPDARASTSSMR